MNFLNIIILFKIIRSTSLPLMHLFLRQAYVTARYIAPESIYNRFNFLAMALANVLFPEDEKRHQLVYPGDLDLKFQNFRSDSEERNTILPDQ